MKIAETLATTPDVLLGVADAVVADGTAAELRERITAACGTLDPPLLAIILAQVAAVAELRANAEGPIGGGTSKGRASNLIGRPKRASRPKG